MAGERFLISDTHFAHENFLKFTDQEGDIIRRFDSVGEMDQCMIDRWNDVVGPKDKVYHLGDVCFRMQEFQRIMPLLNGHKTLILGNHDRFDVNVYRKFFKRIYSLRILDSDPQVILSHAPLHPSSVGERFNIHGHIHERVIDDPRYYNVSVEQTGYSPIPFDDLIMHLRSLVQ